MTKVRAIWIGIGIGTGIGLGMALGLVLFRDASQIAVAWGNARAEYERRLTAEAPQRAEAARAKREAEVAEEARQAANETYNEANCKVTVKGDWSGVETIAGVRRISKHYQDGTCYILHLAGGVERHFHTVLKTEGCK